MWGRALVCLSVLPWPLASAAPWIQDKGGFYARGSAASERLEGAEGWRWDAYSEYGLSDDWTITTKYETVYYPNDTGLSGQGWRVTARRSLYDIQKFTFSAELGLLEGRAIGGGVIGCDALGFEARAGAGWSDHVWQRDIFAFAEIAQRNHEDCLRDRYEAGLGVQVFGPVSSVTQVWLERRNPFGDSDKVQSELLWRLKHHQLSVGYRWETSGDFEEDGVFLAYARQM